MESLVNAFLAATIMILVSATLAISILGMLA